MFSLHTFTVQYSINSIEFDFFFFHKPYNPCRFFFILDELALLFRSSRADARLFFFVVIKINNKKNRQRSLYTLGSDDPACSFSGLQPVAAAALELSAVMTITHTSHVDSHFQGLGT